MKLMRLVRVMKTTLLITIILLGVESRAIFQSDNIGETMDGSGIITISNHEYFNQYTSMPGAQLLWDQDSSNAPENS